MKVDDYGLYQDGEIYITRTEEDFFEKLGMGDVPCCLR